VRNHNTPLLGGLNIGTSRFLWEKESNLHPLLFAEKKKNSLSWHHTLARGWPAVKTPGAVVPMVGWKVVHPSTVTTLFIF
jgi:hypothetical protein